MPHISASVYCALLLHVVSTFYLIQKSLGRCNLVRAHHKQQVLLCQHTEACEDVEQRMAREEGGGEVNKVVEYLIAGICPIAGKLKRVACLGLVLVPSLFNLIDMAVTGRIAVVLCLCTVAHHKDLDILKQSVSCPERLSSVAIYLVESLFDANTTFFQLDVYQRQAIDKDADIVTIRTCAVPYFVLVDHLCTVGMNIIFLYQVDVLFLAIVALQGLHEVGLDGSCLVYDAFALRSNLCLEETAPFIVCEVVVVQFLQFYTQIADEFILVVYLDIFITLTLELLDKRTLQVGFGLIAAVFHHCLALVVSHYGTGVVFRKNVVGHCFLWFLWGVIIVTIVQNVINVHNVCNFLVVISL